ncbi:MAG: SIR2 family protein [Nitrospinae bacterium]|nr:SIR2 family protein [Nitrospinota bacterium]
MKNLIESIRNRRAILFVGAGISMNLGLPSFKELTDHLGKELEYDPEIFSLFGEDPALAEYYLINKGTLEELRLWMDKTFHNPKIEIGKSHIHKSIVELNFPIIYTTNYDRWLEKAFEYYKKNFVKIVTVSDFPKISSNSTQIIKFHGDFDNEASIVLTESSYYERMALDSPIDTKLKCDALGKTILFLGYSLSDVNVRYLLFKINQQWKNINNNENRPKSYIFLTRPNLIQQTILEKWGIIPIISEEDNPHDGITKFLNGLVAK